MAINLSKSINLIKKTSTSIDEKLSGVNSDVKIKSDDIEQAIKDIEDLIDKLDTECEPTDKPKKPDKPRKKNGTGKKKVQIRPPRSYKPRDLKRIARKVMDDNGDCPSGQALIAAAVLSETNAEHWIDIIIRMLLTIHEMYVILYDASDFGYWTRGLNSLKGAEIWLIGDFIDYLIDLIVFVLEIPRKLVLLLEPVDRFVMAFRRFLIKFRDLIVSMV